MQSDRNGVKVGLFLTQCTLYNDMACAWVRNVNVYSCFLSFGWVSPTSFNFFENFFQLVGNKVAIGCFLNSQKLSLTEAHLPPDVGTK